MKEVNYKKFSLSTHQKNWGLKRPNTCQFELTFACGLRCRHCYTGCYNQSRYIRKELSAKEVKIILDKVYQSGVLWLCFTGGDPLNRRDFLEIYGYARKKGFIITIFTNAYSMDGRIAAYLRNNPPFAIEITLNAAREALFEDIAQVKGSFNKTMKGIDLILRAKLPLKIKTLVTKDNLRELPRIKKFIEERELKFNPSPFLHNKLNGDLDPSGLRISPDEAMGLNGRKKASQESCDPSLRSKAIESKPNLFRCVVAGGDGIHIDPYGNIFPCNCIRQPRINLLKNDLHFAKNGISNWVKTRYFTGNFKCHNCQARDLCYNCPGKAVLDAGDLEGTVKWFCELAHLRLGKAF